MDISIAAWLLRQHVERSWSTNILAESLLNRTVSGEFTVQRNGESI